MGVSKNVSVFSGKSAKFYSKVLWKRAFAAIPAVENPPFSNNIQQDQVLQWLVLCYFLIIFAIQIF
jgi:hypothetical protein